MCALSVLQLQAALSFLWQHSEGGWGRQNWVPLVRVRSHSGIEAELSPEVWTPPSPPGPASTEAKEASRTQNWKGAPLSALAGRVDTWEWVLCLPQGVETLSPVHLSEELRGQGGNWRNKDRAERQFPETWHLSPAGGFVRQDEHLPLAFSCRNYRFELRETQFRMFSPITLALSRWKCKWQTLLTATISYWKYDRSVKWWLLESLLHGVTLCSCKYLS